MPRDRFCKAFQHCDQEKRQRVLWSGEAVLRVPDSGGESRETVMPSPYSVPTSRRPPPIMVWAASPARVRGVGSAAESCHNEQGQLPGTFVPLSAQLLWKCAADFFMQERAPRHTALDVTQWLRDCQVSFFEEWPNNTSHLSAIESLWSIMKQIVLGMDT